MGPVLVPTLEKLRFRFRFQLHIYAIKSNFFLKNLFPFYIVSCFTRKKIININKFTAKSYGSYGSGSGSTTLFIITVFLNIFQNRHLRMQCCWLELFSPDPDHSHSGSRCTTFPFNTFISILQFYDSSVQNRLLLT